MTVVFLFLLAVLVVVVVVVVLDSAAVMWMRRRDCDWKNGKTVGRRVRGRHRGRERLGSWSRWYRGR